MSPQDLLSKLPSLNELVEHPRVRRAVDQWNRSEALARVRTAVQDLSSEVSRRAEDLAAKSPGDIVEQLIERLQRPTHVAPSRVVNASGELWGPRWPTVPLADTALDAACRSGWSYASDESLETEIAGLLSAADARVLATPLAALAAGLEACGARNEDVAGGDAKRGDAKHGDLVVAKTDAGDVQPGCSLAMLARGVGLQLVEVGGPAGATLSDYTHALEASPAPRGLLVRHHDSLRVEGGVPRPTIAELAPLAHQHAASLLVDLGGGPPIETPNETPNDANVETGVETLSAQAVLSAGADAVVLSGVGLVGGPPCGVLAGDHDLVETAGKTHSGKIGHAGPMATAALAATLELFAEPERLRFIHPLYQRLDTPLDNLRTRAERLALQIGVSARVNAAEAVPLAADQAVGPIGLVRLPSWGIAIDAPDPDGLRADLLAGSVAIVARPGLLDGKLLLDLRAVAPAEDSRLAAAFADETADSE